MYEEEETENNGQVQLGTLVTSGACDLITTSIRYQQRRLDPSSWQHGWRSEWNVGEKCRQANKRVIISRLHAPALDRPSRRHLFGCGNTALQHRILGAEASSLSWM